MPLGDGDQAVCPYCKAEVPLPEAHRALRDADRADHAARDQAAALAARIGRPPWLLLRVLAWNGFLVLALLFAPFVIVGLLVAALDVMAALERGLHMALSEVLGPGRTWALIGAIDALLVGAYLVLGAYGRRSATSRRALQALLAAGPPERPGGPASCRECGAPLTVSKDALAARCGYCHADNLVAVDAAWLRGAKVDRRAVKRTIHEALSDESRERYRLRRSIIKRGAALLVGFALLFGWGLLSPSGWARAVAAQPRRLASYDLPPSHVIVAGAPAAPLRVDGECTGEGCVTILEVALRYRERLIVERTDEGEPATLFVRGVQPGSPSRDRVDLAKRLLEAGTPFELAVPHSGFFSVWLVASHRTAVTIRAAIAPPS